MVVSYWLDVVVLFLDCNTIQHRCFFEKKKDLRKDLRHRTLTRKALIIFCLSANENPGSFNVFLLKLFSSVRKAPNDILTEWKEASSIDKSPFLNHVNRPGYNYFQTVFSSYFYHIIRQNLLFVMKIDQSKRKSKLQSSPWPHKGWLWFFI